LGERDEDSRTVVDAKLLAENKSNSQHRKSSEDSSISHVQFSKAAPEIGLNLEMNVRVTGRVRPELKREALLSPRTQCGRQIGSNAMKTDVGRLNIDKIFRLVWLIKILPNQRTEERLFRLTAGTRDFQLVGKESGLQ
jgi:hypothetical protein